MTHARRDRRVPGHHPAGRHRRERRPVAPHPAADRPAGRHPVMGSRGARRIGLTGAHRGPHEPVPASVAPVSAPAAAPAKARARGSGRGRLTRVPTTTIHCPVRRRSGATWPVAVHARSPAATPTGSSAPLDSPMTRIDAGPRHPPGPSRGSGPMAPVTSGRTRSAQPVGGDRPDPDPMGSTGQPGPAPWRSRRCRPARRCRRRSRPKSVTPHRSRRRCTASDWWRRPNRPMEPTNAGATKMPSVPSSPSPRKPPAWPRCESSPGWPRTGRANGVRPSSTSRPTRC